MKVIFAKPYQDVRDICHQVKVSVSDESLTPWVADAAKALPNKCIIVPVPGCSGVAGNTTILARDLAQETNRLFPDKTAVVFDCLQGAVRDSICTRKEKGLPFDDVVFDLRFKDGDTEKRFRQFVDDGWRVILFDNVIDTGTTMRAAIAAIGLPEDKCHCAAIGDTKAWTNF